MMAAPNAPRRSRWRRQAIVAFQPGDRVARTLVDLFHLGAADTHAVALLFHSHGTDASAYVAKAWPRVWRAGFVTKLAVPVSPAQRMTAADVYCVETGLAQAVMDAGQPLDRLDDAAATQLRARADADRERLVALLAPFIADVSAINRRLKVHSEQARRCLLGSSNLLAHAVKNAGFVAPLLYAARRAGYTVEVLRGDKDVLLRVATPRGEVQRAPDTTVVLAAAGRTTALLVETETGTSSAQKLRAKVDAWATIGEAGLGRAVAAALGNVRIDAAQIIVYGPPRILATVEAAIAARCDARTRQLFRTVRDSVVNTHFPAAVFRRNAVIPGTQQRCLDFFRALCHAPIAGVVQPTSTRTRPEVRWFPLL